jgi:hypothetical protein
MKKSRILKLSTLIGLNACSDQVELFGETFGESVRVTEKLCLSVSDKFAWSWGASHLLSARPRTEYERVTYRAWAKYKHVAAPALAEYERLKDLAWAEFVRAIAPARAEYERVTARALAKYERAEALSFARGYLS